MAFETPQEKHRPADVISAEIADLDERIKRLVRERDDLAAESDRAREATIPRMF